MKPIKVSNAYALRLSIKECETLKQAEEILRNMQFDFGGETTIMSLETAEVVTPGELARARGVLDFFATYRMVEINPQ